MQTPRIVRTTLKKIQDGGLLLLHFNTYYAAKVIKTIWCWHQIGQWNRVEPTNRPTYLHKLFLTKVERQLWRKDSFFFFQKWHWHCNHWIFLCMIINFDPYLTLWNSELIMYLNLKLRTIKFLEGHIGEKFLWPWLKQKHLGLETKSTIHIKKDW